jgi:hypothetical protein
MKKPTRFLLWVGRCCSNMLASISYPRTHTGLQQQQQGGMVVLGIIVITELLYRVPAKLA